MCVVNRCSLPSPAECIDEREAVTAVTGRRVRYVSWSSEVRCLEDCIDERELLIAVCLRIRRPTSCWIEHFGSPAEWFSSLGFEPTFVNKLLKARRMTATIVENCQVYFFHSLYHIIVVPNVTSNGSCDLVCVGPLSARCSEQNRTTRRPTTHHKIASHHSGWYSS